MTLYQEIVITLYQQTVKIILTTCNNIITSSSQHPVIPLYQDYTSQLCPGAGILYQDYTSQLCPSTGVSCIIPI